MQRVAVAGAPTGETLYNQAAPAGQAGSKHYSITANYEMTRAGDSGATVSVRIKFLSQARNTVPPPPGVPNAPKLGQLVGPQTEIPPGDPRRGWATTMAGEAVKTWNGRLTLAGEEWNAFGPNTPKRLPVTFQAIPVWGLNEEAHNVVIVHPQAVQAGSAGNPIDAGNYYLNKNDQVYPASDSIIYAHEYGHLIGIPDEYSQSNAQMNALLHQAAPAGAASAMAALDRTTIERMTLAALANPLWGQLQATMSRITDALRAQRPLVKARMASAARAGAVTAGVRGELIAGLSAVADPSLGHDVPNIVAFETSANFSNLDLASQGVEAGFDPAVMSRQIGDAYWLALLAPQDPTVAVAGLGDIRVTVVASMYSAAGPGTPQAAAAGSEAASVVGPTTMPGLPAVPPAGSLVSLISAAPARWAAAGSALQSAITPGIFATRMQEGIRSASAAQAGAAAALAAAGMPPPRIPRAGALYRRAYQLVTNAARAAAQQVATDLVAATVTPALAGSVSSLQTAITAEVNRLMTTPPAALAAAGPPDPSMAAIVAAMRARLDAAKAATAGSGRDPLGAGAPAPAQDVTYSYQGLMGSSATTGMRADQFQPVVDQFNDKLKTFFETKFTAEVK